MTPDVYCPYECEALQEDMKDAAASHLQRAGIICLFLHLSVFSVPPGGRWEGDNQRSAFSSDSRLQTTGDARDTTQETVAGGR